jgi:putative spermidine/putrescine transport system permease protein
VPGRRGGDPLLPRDHALTATSSRVAPYALSGPALTLLAVFIVVPLALIAFISFQTPSATALWRNVWTIDNYRRGLTDVFYLRILGASLRIAAITTLLCILVSYPIAYHLARATGTLRGVCMFLVLCPLLVSTVIRSFGWIVILGDGGAVNAVLAAVGIGRRKLLYSEAAVIVGLTHFLVPFMALPLMVAIERIPTSVEEAARSLGTRSLGVFRLVILPLSFPGLVAGAVLVFTLAVSAVVTPLFLGGRKVQMIGTQIYDNVAVAFNWPFAGALTVMAIAVTVAAILVARHIAGRESVASRARSDRQSEGGTIDEQHAGIPRAHAT